LATYLDFESSIKFILRRYYIPHVFVHDEGLLKSLQDKLDREVSKIFSNLSPFSTASIGSSCG